MSVLLKASHGDLVNLDNVESICTGVGDVGHGIYALMVSGDQNQLLEGDWDEETNLKLLHEIGKIVGSRPVGMVCMEKLADNVLLGPKVVVKL